MVRLIRSLRPLYNRQKLIARKRTTAQDGPSRSRIIPGFFDHSYQVRCKAWVSTADFTDKKVRNEVICCTLHGSIVIPFCEGRC
jgi:hypothetical protein